MNPQLEPEKWHESPNYLKLLSSMSMVRWLVAKNRHRRPESVLEIKTLMERLGKFVIGEVDVDYATQLQAVSAFVRLTIQELRYFADIAEWIEIDRQTIELNDDEYDQYFGSTKAPSMFFFHSPMGGPPTDKALQEICELNGLFYGPSDERPCDCRAGDI